MKRTFYIASSRDRLEDVRRLASELEAGGMRSAFAWYDHFDHRCSVDVCGIRDRRQLARKELSAVAGCDLFVGIARLGKGSYVELAVALTGLCARVILVGVERSDSVFYEAPVEHVDDIAGLMLLLGAKP